MLMKICGLITEYNPFHNGHVHHMQEARRVSGCDYLIVVMSGDFVQRGTPAVIDKYSRADMALMEGADLVLELPTLFSTATAEVFAFSAISLLHQLGSVDSVCFGTEIGEIAPLKKIAEFLNNEPARYKQTLKENLRAGLSYPAARQQALEEALGDSIENLQEILNSPNNILGIEYLKALDKLSSSMTPFTVHRWKTEHNMTDAVYSDVASATALRNMLYEEDGFEKIIPFVPANTAREIALKYGVSCPVRADDFSEILQYDLMRERKNLSEYLDFSLELQERVNNLLPDCYTFKEWASALKTKSYTHTRINRALLHLILNIKEKDLEEYREDDYCLYARILGFRKEAAPLFTAIKKNSGLPLISKMADARNILSEKALRLLLSDVASADVYRNIVYQKFGTLLSDEYTAGILIR